MPTADETAGWDDVAAISQSWDRVVDDYRVFHAVRARGGTVDDLPAFSPQETRPDGQAETAGGDKGEDGLAQEQREASLSHAAADKTQPAVEPGAGYTTASPGLLPPQAVLKDADENLKKLLMSWYYAGYYTGHYEGQQQAQQTTQTPQVQHELQTTETDKPVHGDDGHGPGEVRDDPDPDR